MAEKIRSVKEILEELFVGKDAALEKYAKVRHVQYELNLWHENGLPLGQVESQAKKYFSVRFLDGKNIYAVERENPELLEKALRDLDYAVKCGCHGRCSRLVKELNEELAGYKIEPVDSEKFLDWLTFCYSVRKDYCTGEPVNEPGFSFEIKDFYDDKNRKEFWKELKFLLKDGRIMSMSNVLKVVYLKRNHSKNL